jgi:preprotein translocase subunit YajC
MIQIVLLILVLSIAYYLDMKRIRKEEEWHNQLMKEKQKG